MSRNLADLANVLRSTAEMHRDVAAGLSEFIALGAVACKMVALAEQMETTATNIEAGEYGEPQP